MRRIGFGIDVNGFFAVLFDGDTARVRLASDLSCDVAMRRGIVWAEHLQVPVDVVRVDTRLLEMHQERGKGQSGRRVSHTSSGQSEG